MATVKYDLGDILTWCKDGDCYATAVIVRWHTKDVYVEGISLNLYTNYDVFVKSHEKDDFELAHGVPECAFFHYEVVGHIDISGMSLKEIDTELVYVITFVRHENRIAYAVQNHWELMKFRKKEIYIPKMTDENCCYDGRDKLEKENRRLKEEISSQNDKIFELNKEIDRLRNSCTNDRFRIATNLRKIGFTSETIRRIIETDMV